MKRARQANAANALPSRAHRVLRGLLHGTVGVPLQIAARRAGIEFPRQQRGSEIATILMTMSYIAGAHERNVVRLYRRLLLPGMVAIDIGAHAGYHTSRFARLISPGGRVVAFEPFSPSFEVLSRNIERKRCANVTLEPMAVWRETGTVRLFMGGTTAGNSAVVGGVEAGIVPCVRLDDYVRRHGMSRVDLVKVDAEGAEPDVIDGMRDVLAESERLGLVMEFYPKMLDAAGHDPHTLIDTMRDLGMSVYDIRRDGRLLPVEAYGSPREFTRQVSIRPGRVTPAGWTNLFCAKGIPEAGR